MIKVKKSEAQFPLHNNVDIVRSLFSLLVLFQPYHSQKESGD